MVPARRMFGRENRGVWDIEAVIECRSGVARLGDNASRSAIIGRQLACKDCEQLFGRPSGYVPQFLCSIKGFEDAFDDESLSCLLINLIVRKPTRSRSLNSM